MNKPTPLSVAGKLIPSLLISLFFCVGLNATAQAQTHSLDYYLNNAIQNSPTITAQQNSADSARLQKDLINADLNRPYVSASGDYMYAPYGDNWGYDPAITDGGHYAALLNVDFPVFTGKQNRVRSEASSILIRQTDFRINQVKHELRHSVTDQYITVYQDELNLQYLQDIVDLLNRQKQVVDTLAKQGQTRIIDLKQLNIELQNTRVSLKKAQNTYQQDLMQLNIQCGISDVSTSINLQRPAIQLDTTKMAKSRFMNQYKLDSLDVAAQQRVSELKYRPQITLSGNTGLNAVKFTGIQNHLGFSVGLHASVPIYDGGQRAVNRQQSRLQQRSIDAYQQQFKVKRRLRLMSLQQQLNQTKEERQLLQQQIVQYEDLLDDFRKELRHGLSSMVEYLTALRNYIDARQQLLQTQGKQLHFKNEFRYWNW